MYMLLKMHECSPRTKLFIKSFLMQIWERHIRLKSFWWWAVPWVSWSQYSDLHTKVEGDQFCPWTHPSTCIRWMRTPTLDAMLIGKCQFFHYAGITYARITANACHWKTRWCVFVITVRLTQFTAQEAEYLPSYYQLFSSNPGGEMP